MSATLFVIPASHPATAARLMLERKGIPYKRVDLVAAMHRVVLKAAGFPAMTVPALVIDGVHIQGSRRIARALDVLAPEPPLYPSDPEARSAVEQAEHWGDEVLQPVPRRIVWAALKRDHSTIDTFLEGARLGVPVSLAAKTAAPVVMASAFFNRARDEIVEADLKRLPALLDRVDELIEKGVLNGAELNAADYQIATSVRLMLCLEDLAPLLAGRPAAEHARRVVPDFPGHVPAVLPPGWVPR